MGMEHVCPLQSSSPIGASIFLSMLITEDGPPPCEGWEHRVVRVRAVECPTREKQTEDLHNLMVCVRD